MTNLRPQPDDPYRPWWYKLFPFLGRPPELTRRQWRVLGLVAVVSFFEQYDLYLFSLNLKHIQADLALAEEQLGLLGAIVRAGALPAILVTLMADRLGRRRILLFTVVAYTLLTGATALSPDATTFVTLQFLARTFAAAETLIAVVVIAEEFPREHRGWGIGALGAIMACGAGGAALMFGLVDHMPHGWRDLYLVGLLPLVLVAYWRRTLPETDRYLELERERERGGASGAEAASSRATPALRPLVDLVRIYPGRFALLGGAVFVLGLASNPALFFAPKYLQDVHGWSPGAVATLNFLGGAIAIIANPVAGRLSDLRGRRPVTFLFAVSFCAVTLAFYAAAGMLVPALWVAMIFAHMGSEVTFSAFGAELFPTSYRSTASGARSVAYTVGAVAGLSLVSALYGAAGSNWSAISLLLLVALIVPLLVLAFPETAGRTLEEIAPERADEPAPAPVAVNGGEAHVPR